MSRPGVALARFREHLTWRYERLARHLPTDLVGTLDLVLPYMEMGWRGPLNGQAFRQNVVRNIADALDVDLVIETGTFRGYSTAFFANAFHCAVWTVESNRRWYAHTRARFIFNRRVTVKHGDSRSHLRALARTANRDDLVFVYLDAHWEEDIPLRGELAVIAETWRRAVVMIDDFEVPDDPGYEFDDYGPGKAFKREYLKASAVATWPAFYPSASSAEETGRRRGCCVLMSPTLDVLPIVGLRTAV
jgi:hypothetical protein